MIRRVGALMLFLIVITASLCAADGSAVSIDEILAASGARLQWDAARRTGTLWKGFTTIRFRPGRDYAVVNGEEILDIGLVENDGGSIRFAAHGAGEVISRLASVSSGEQRRIAAILIDPGHGGRDPGTIGRHSLDGNLFEIHEKDIVLDVSHRLRQLLEATYPDRRIVMSREDDTYLTLEQRTDLANAIEIQQHETVLFVSVHANASLNSRARGVEVWYLTPEFRRPDLLDPDRAGVSDPQVLTILNTMREEEITIESVLLARSILSGIYSEVGDVSPNRGLKNEAWYVVREAKMPSVLVELGFVTNRDEAVLLGDSRYLQRLAEGIYNGIVTFVAGFEQ